MQRTSYLAHACRIFRHLLALLHSRLVHFSLIRSLFQLKMIFILQNYQIYSSFSGFFHFNGEAKTIQIVAILVCLTLCLLHTIIAFGKWRKKLIRLNRGRYGDFNYNATNFPGKYDFVFKAFFFHLSETLNKSKL